MGVYLMENLPSGLGDEAKMLQKFGLEDDSNTDLS